MPGSPQEIFSSMSLDQMNYLNKEFKFRLEKNNHD
jgi:hypothetical protein